MPKRIRSYPALRGALYGRYSLGELGKILGKTQQAMSKKMVGGSPWKREEMYAVLELLGLPDDQLPILFPKEPV